MPIDQKKIEEWKALADSMGGGARRVVVMAATSERTAEIKAASEMVTHAFRDIVAPLLSERESLLSLLREVRDGVTAAIVECYEGDTHTVASALRRVVDDDRLAAFLREG